MEPLYLLWTLQIESTTIGIDSYKEKKDAALAAARCHESKYQAVGLYDPDTNLIFMPIGTLDDLNPILSQLLPGVKIG